MIFVDRQLDVLNSAYEHFHVYVRVRELYSFTSIFHCDMFLELGAGVSGSVPALFYFHGV